MFSRESFFGRIFGSNKDKEKVSPEAGIIKPSAKKEEESDQRAQELKQRAEKIRSADEAKIKKLREQIKKESEIGSTEFISDEKALEEIKSLLGAEEHKIVEHLAGIDSEEAWEIRQELFAKSESEIPILKSLAGLDSDRAWVMREEFLKKGYFKGDLTTSLAGLDSDRAWAMREQFLQDADRQTLEAKNLSEKQKENFRMDAAKVRGNLAISLTGLDSDRARAMRAELENYEAHIDLPSPEALLIGETGLDDFPSNYRRKYLSEYGLREYAVESLTGIDSDEAWSVRDLYFSRTKRRGGFLARSLAGLDSDRAWAMREELIKTGDINEAAESLAGLDSDRARAMRAELIKAGADKDHVALGINGDSITAIAWRKKMEREQSEKGGEK